MKQEIEELLKKVGIPIEVIQPVLNTYKPAYELILGEPEDYSLVGSSRVGGVADLPSYIPYPTSKSGHPLQLITQINLSELLVDVIPQLFKRGWLYFFELFQEDFTVIYFDGDSSELKFSHLNTEEFAEYSEPYNSLKIAFNLIPTIDTAKLYNLLYDYLPEDRADNCRTNFEDIYGSKNLIGGNDQCIGVDSIVSALVEKGAFSDMEKKMYKQNLHIDGNDVYPRFHYWDEQLKLRPNDVGVQDIVKQNDEAIAYAPTFVENRKFYQKELNKWHSLLTVKSIDECNMLWNDSGLLTFCIHEDDLLKRNFDNIYTIIDGG